MKKEVLLFAILTGSAPYIDVPATKRIAVQKKPIQVFHLPTALAITFSFNITLSTPLH